MINTVNLMKPNPAQPFDLQSQQAALAQQAAIAQALIAKSMENSSPIIHTGGGNQFARDVPNFGDPIASVAQAFIGGKQRDEANAGQARLNEEMQRRTAGELDAITRTRFGIQPGGTGVDDSGNQMPDVQGKPNFIAALRQAQQATTPAGKAMAVELNKAIPTPEKFLEHGKNYSPEGMAAFQSSLDPTALAGRGQVQLHDNMALSTRDGSITGSQPVQTFKLDTTAIPGLPTSVSQTTGEVKGISGGSQTPPAKIEEYLGQANVKQLEEGKKDYIADSGRLQNIAQIKTSMAAIPDSKFGTASEWRQSVSKFGELLGWDKLPTTNDLEVLHNKAGELLLENVRKLAPVTNEDVAIVKGIVGSEGMTKRGLAQVMDVLQAATERSMKRHQSLVAAFPLPQGSSVSRQALEDIYAPPFTIAPQPAAGTSNPYKNMSDDEIRKQLRGG